MLVSFLQYFINVPDSDVEKFLKLFTFWSLEEIASVMKKQQVG
jgi:tyrosyl-tRNA synthetase